MPVVIPAAGLSPAGLFVSQAFADPTKPPGILAYAIDPTTGEYLSISRGMHPIDQQVIIALKVKRRSGAAVMNDGQRFSDIKKVDDTAQARIDSETRTALARLLKNGDIEIISLVPVADQDTDTGTMSLRYRNLRAKGAQERSLTVLP